MVQGGEVKRQEENQAQKQVDRFVRQFEPSYRQLTYYAALPLVLTPELLHYLRNQFLSHIQLPWVAEADLLLSDLCRPVGYEQYAMDAAVRAYLVGRMEDELGEARLRDVAKLLLTYVEYLHDVNPYISRQDLKSQQLAAMVYVDATHRRTAVEELVKSYQKATEAIESAPYRSDALSEMTRLSYLTAELEKKLLEPEYASLLNYARTVSQLINHPEQPIALPSRMFQVLDDITLKIPEVLLPSVNMPDGGDFSQFPQFKTLEFEMATVQMPGEDSREVVFQIQRVEVVTIELLDEDAPEEEGVQRFYFEIATLDPEDTIQRQQGHAWEWIETLGENIELEMVYIPPGEFLMGSPSDEPGRYDWESPQHRVTVSQFYMGRYPITQAQWRVVAALPRVNCDLEPDPSNFKGDNRPVESVNWYDAVEFCERLSRETGRAYRLPTEAEWEYACRAGTTTPYHFGETITKDLASYERSEEEGTTPVDHYGIANAFGLSEMHGNVYEWCQDHWHGSYEGAPTDGSAWLTDDEEAGRVLRGGSWSFNSWYCRSAFRIVNYPVNRDSDDGFRVVCGVPRT